ncbi:FAD linked oxidase domain protein [Bacillus thuringiensis serovar pakistani str. T13001]|nr:FAD linked oxidase domain protein [Bacillus thuringiensis serovar pakistani str. T13001]
MKRRDIKEKNYRNYDVRFLIEMVYHVRVHGQELMRNEICSCEK